jgi:hypothetical protein
MQFDNFSFGSIQIDGSTYEHDVMQEVRREAERHKIKLLVLPTIEAIEMLNQNPKDTNAILHVTC